MDGCEDADGDEVPVLRRLLEEQEARLDRLIARGEMETVRAEYKVLLEIRRELLEAELHKQARLVVSAPGAREPR